MRALASSLRIIAKKLEFPSIFSYSQTLRESGYVITFEVEAKSKRWQLTTKHDKSGFIFSKKFSGAAPNQESKSNPDSLLAAFREVTRNGTNLSALTCKTICEEDEKLWFVFTPPKWRNGPGITLLVDKGKIVEKFYRR